VESQRAKTSLLFVIAVSLVLIVLKLYSGDFVSEASAQIPAIPPGGMYGCAQMITEHMCTKWIPVRVDSQGKLLVSSH
jgi:hypothetical protein